MGVQGGGRRPRPQAGHQPSYQVWPADHPPFDPQIASILEQACQMLCRRRPSKWTRARKPSSFGSKSQPAPTGKVSADRASIGMSGRWRTTKKV